MQDLPAADKQIPHRFHLLPATGVREVSQPLAQHRLGMGTPPHRTPPVEVSVRPPVAGLQFVNRHPPRLEDGVPCVVQIPVFVQDPSLRTHPPVQRGARIGRQDVESGGLDALADRPVDRTVEHIGSVAVHAEHERGIHHHTEVVQPAYHRRVVPANVLALVLPGEVRRVHRLEPDEQASQPGRHRLFEQAGREYRIDGAGRLPDTAEARHTVEERGREAAVTKQVIVQKVQMPSR